VAKSNRPGVGLPARTTRVTPSFELDAFLPYRLAVLAHAVSRAFSKVYADRFGLSVGEWRVLANLGASGALTAGDIAVRTSLDKPKVTRALQRLQVRGLIVRTTGADDRREVHVQLSASGRRMFHDIAPLAVTWEQGLLSALSLDQRQQLTTCLDLLIARVAALSEKP
jgi:DNA-binding MarR family transcriptional regulator